MSGEVWEGLGRSGPLYTSISMIYFHKLCYVLWCIMMYYDVLCSLNKI